MATRAVIFDFFGTLTVAADRRHRAGGHARVAAALGVDTATYAAAIEATWTERATGRLGDLETTMRAIAEACGVDPSPDTLAAVCRERRTSQREYLQLRDEAVPTLRALKDRGLGTGLVSDCTVELPESWPELAVAAYVDAPVFSVRAGVKKPSPEIFRLCCERLGVAPEDCVYVGDGDSDELAGATAVGMRAYRLVCADHANGHHIQPVRWEGARIGGLTQVLDLL